jgi:hypothetical protein
MLEKGSILCKRCGGNGTLYLQRIVFNIH